MTAPPAGVVTILQIGSGNDSITLNTHGGLSPYGLIFGAGYGFNHWPTIDLNRWYYVIFTRTDGTLFLRHALQGDATTTVSWDSDVGMQGTNPLGGTG